VLDVRTIRDASFDDGDVTGMEIEEGVLRLVQWPSD
jgi:hypothetical protein